MTESSDRLRRQIEFILEIDKLKKIRRRTYLTDQSRKENDAEHSWHLAAMAILLSEHAAGDVNVTRVMKMVLIHDIVEIDAGDTYAYDEAANRDKGAREQVVAQRVFGLLPENQAGECRALWDEFEAAETGESRFALALDRILPLIMNYDSGGMIWVENGVTEAQVRRRMEPIVRGCPALARLADQLIENAAKEGRLRAE